MSPRPPLPFDEINRAAMARLEQVLERLLRDGERQGSEFLALNPRRLDRNKGSFRVNLGTGRWADFSTGDKGGDVISLVAYLEGCAQYQAAANLARMLGVDTGARRHG